ncbi:MAG TPA: hypothetical protein VJN18_13695 [Polyangiaceae bacterium]|nr:hypothetical protein [Polyangiaceae bacterium]
MIRSLHRGQFLASFYGLTAVAGCTEITKVDWNYIDRASAALAGESAGGAGQEPAGTAGEASGGVPANAGAPAGGAPGSGGEMLGGAAGAPGNDGGTATASGGEAGAGS